VKTHEEIKEQLFFYIIKEQQQKLLKSLSEDLAAITPNTTGADIQNIINLALCKSVLNREKLEGKTPFPSY